MLAEGGTNVDTVLEKTPSLVGGLGGPGMASPHNKQIEKALEVGAVCASIPGKWMSLERLHRRRVREAVNVALVPGARRPQSHANDSQSKEQHEIGRENLSVMKAVVCGRVVRHA